MADAPDSDGQGGSPSGTDVLSVSDLNERIASVVEGASGLQAVRCRGEVTDRHRNETALYFTLADGDAELPCMIWANRYENMAADIENGTEVVLTGDIEYWVEGGKVDLKPWEVAVVGDGEQAAAVERLRAELEDRGWFADDRKQQPPAFPERVGVVTSLRGDARYDVQNAIHEQDPTVDIVVKHATVQGTDAPASIANGIHHLDRSEEVDAIVVGRGGGSDSALEAFDTEPVAEAIFTATTPIVTAVGHTADRTIADRVADAAAITPTAAGEAVVTARDEFRRGELEPLEQELDAAYEALEREQEHERELTEAVEAATEPEGLSPVYYKAAIGLLLLLLLVVTALWLGVI